MSPCSPTRRRSWCAAIVVLLRTVLVFAMKPATQTVPGMLCLSACLPVCLLVAGLEARVLHETMQELAGGCGNSLAYTASHTFAVGWFAGLKVCEPAGAAADDGAGQRPALVAMVQVRWVAWEGVPAFYVHYFDSCSQSCTYRTLPSGLPDLSSSLSLSTGLALSCGEAIGRNMVRPTPPSAESLRRTS